MDRQKIVMIFVGAWISAALLTWFVYSRTSGTGTEKMTRVLAATRDMSAGTRLRKNDVKMVQVTEKDLPKGAIFDQALAIDRVLLFPANTNEPIVTTKLGSVTGAEGLSATIEPGKRAVSVQITDSSSAGGLIQPRAHVDVLFTRTGSMREALTTTILQNVVVLSIGRTVEANQPVDPRAPRPQQQAATLLVTPEEASKLELARNQGKISLALRNPLDKTVIEQPTTATAESLDPAIFAGANRQLGRPPVNVRNDRAWADLTGLSGDGVNSAPAKPKEEKKEPPKPRLVVDVYRGDKHVQEIFQ